MVTGFEEFSYELTELEQQKIYPKFIEAWKGRVVNELIKTNDMISGMQNWIVKQNITTSKGKIYKMTGPRMRKIIHCARVKGDLPNMIATSKGYFRSDDPQEIKNFIKSCRERANSFLEVANAMETYNFER